MLSLTSSLCLKSPEATRKLTPLIMRLHSLQLHACPHHFSCSSNSLRVLLLFNIVNLCPSRN